MHAQDHPFDTMAASTSDVQASYDALRARLARETGPVYWRSLDELATLDEFDALVHREFPGGVTDLLDPVSRRNFLKVMGASVMLAGLASCARQPDETIVPYVRQPEETVPGKPQYFATAATLGGYGVGLVATSHTNRPTKLEGLPEHPSSLGRTDAFAQAALLDLYDPDRLDAVRKAGQTAAYGDFVAALRPVLERVAANQGAGLYLLTETMTSPTFAWQIRGLRERFPQLRWHQYEPANRDNVRRGALDAFGAYVETIYDFSKAAVVLSLDADFLCTGPARIRYAADFASARGPEHGAMNRLYVAECAPTLTGANADHRLSVRYPHIETLARLLARHLGIPGVHIDENAQDALPEYWVEAVVNDLREAGRGRSIVIPGDGQPPVVHALAHAINGVLGNMNETAVYLEPVEIEPTDQTDSLRQLVADAHAGKIELLLILGGNPAYSAPADIDVRGALSALQGRSATAHLTPHYNETSALCAWSVPEAHFLEAWSDVRGHDGTATIVQPLIAPLYAGAKSLHEILELLLGREDAQGCDIVRESWRAQRGAADSETFWKTALSRGLMDGTAAPHAQVQLRRNFPRQAAVVRSGMDVVFRTDPAVFDGRFANNGWLQELPRPLTKLTWDNAVIMSRATAAALGVKDEDIVSVTAAGRTVRGPALIQLGHPDDTVTLHLGYGREQAGRVGMGAGFNVYPLRTADAPWCATGAAVEKSGGVYPLARTESHYLIEQSEHAGRRHLVRETTLTRFREHPDFAQHMGPHAPEPEHTLYGPGEKHYDGYAWGMTIDLNRCTGCNACIVACQAENNIAVVGKEQVLRQREMQWIRVDRYYRADSAAGFDDPETVFQPIPCMQCENAPCEPVCPVGATMHSKEGLNDMVYNRCVGTRYCSNNCPYKVRRFNFYKFADHETPQLKLMRNPNVTVRGRGVMEKCTYCVQRINAARIEAKREDRGIRDGEVVTACQAACPSGAIVFGNIHDAASRVARMKADPRNYGLLADIGTRPRTTYLAKLRNPSPALEQRKQQHAGAASRETGGSPVNAPEEHA